MTRDEEDDAGYWGNKSRPAKPERGEDRMGSRTPRGSGWRSFFGFGDRENYEDEEEGLQEIDEYGKVKPK